MRSLTLVIVSFFSLLIANTGFAQTKKYVRKNKEAPFYTYGDGELYTRGIYSDSTYLYLGNSDGSFIRYNTENRKWKIIAKLASRGENRDVDCSDSVLFVMQSGDHGSLMKINNQGDVGFIEKNEWRDTFFDGIDFYGKTGFLMGDPKDGKFTLYHTKDAGETWTPCKGSVKAIEGEAGFAASGTNVCVANDSTYMFISGGMRSVFYKSEDSGETWEAVDIPYYPSDASGAFSMSFDDDFVDGVIVGGNYKQPELQMNTTYYTHDGGETWYNSFNPPGGYRSCVIHHNGIFYACGTNGMDFSYNGEDWIPFAAGKFYAMTVHQGRIIATMPKGKFKSFSPIQ